MAMNNKRRKLEGVDIPPKAPASPATPVMSAFAARQQLWGAPLPVAKTPVNKNQTSAQKDSTPAKTIPTRRNKRGAAKEQVSTPVNEDPTPDLNRERGDSIPPSPILSPVLGTLIPPVVRERQPQYSSLKPHKKNYQQKPDGCVALRTPDGERLVILGSYGIGVHQGEATIAGAQLTPLDPVQWIHAPHCHALPVLRTSEDTVVELHPHPAADGLRQLAKLNPAFGKLWNEVPTQGVPSKKDSTFQILFSPEDVPKKVALQELVSPPEWNKKLASLIATKRKGASSPIFFLCGPKSSGKSTFGKLLANRLITDRAGNKNAPWSPIYILDIDPGQPEFGPPGVISLVKLTSPNLQPPFCHPTLEPVTSMIRSHAIAAVTPALDPEHFIECVMDLFTTYQTQTHPGEEKKPPMVVNTPGWIQGLGLDILSDLVKGIKPTEVVYMSTEGPEETISGLQAAISFIPTTAFSTLPSQNTTEILSPSRIPSSLRTMQAMSYFHLLPSLSTWNSTPLSHAPPWRVRYTGPDRGFRGILCYDYQPSPRILAEAINGMVLALVKISNLAALRGLDNIIEAGSGKMPLIDNPMGKSLDPKFSELVGLVLVRGVDERRGELQLLTPVGMGGVEKGEGRLVLVMGKFDTPSWCYSEELFRGFRGCMGVRTGGRGGRFGGLGGIWGGVRWWRGDEVCWGDDGLGYKGYFFFLVIGLYFI
ncbi:Polynucleotide 5'-hydroxyl-kinase grc3 [Podospora pseudopauciseta]|uniref:Polynucleotide 5'-hydroxyl-kinase GRC3 n=1 Tax=Podospora pseudopauciseta TaxID=2093780 RepID=A0ABR0HAR8_9PEZI|nr:Polynucleotide 5'-hydroxyl-kinase grc3 [Podospora pseudopauciseta]